MAKAKFKLKKGMIIGIVILVIVIAAVLIAYNVGPNVSAQGTSTLKVQPDEVSVYVSIEARNASAQDAESENSKISEGVVSALKGIGLNESEIKFGSYSIYPEYDYSGGKQKLIDYVASQQIVVKTGRFDKISGVIDESVASGALVSSINFELSDAKQSDYKTQALEAAGKDAQAKAEATAKGLGKSLGRLVSVSAQNFNYNPWNYYSRAGGVMAADNAAAEKAASSIVSLTPQDMEVSATIDVEYKLSLI